MPGSELLSIEAGLQIGPENRYKIIRRHHSTENTPFLYSHTTYIATDILGSRYVTLRVLGKHANSQNEAYSASFVMREIGTSEQREKFFLPIDSFNMENQYTCLVFELCGPELYYVRKTFGPFDGVFPSTWISKVIGDALQSLDSLHSMGIVHGSIVWWSLVITYPKLKHFASDQVVDFFGKENVNDAVVFNETGTGGLEVAYTTNFVVKLQNFKRAFSMGIGPSIPVEHYIDDIECPPPELVTEQQLSAKTDIWNLGLIFVDLLAGTPDFDSIIGGRTGTPQERLARAERLLGPEFDLYQVVQENLKMMLEDGQMDEEEKEPDVFSEGELKTAVDLLKHMLAWNPQDRISASQALNHAFFQNGVDEAENMEN